MSDFLSGGQVTTHKFRMFGQVAKLVLRLNVIVAILCFCYGFYRDISPTEWKIGIAWTKKELFISIDPNKRIEYQDRYGAKHVTTAKEFAHNAYVKSVLGKFERTYKKGLVMVAISVFVVMLGMIVFFLLRGRRLRATSKIRGSSLISARDLKRKIRKHNRIFSQYVPFEIAKFEYAGTGSRESYTSGEQSHTLIVGATGSGKTRIINSLLFQLHQKRKKAIIVDVKGDFIKNFYCKNLGGIILNPIDERGENWNIFKETDALRGFSTIAKCLLPRDSESDPMWTEAARAVFAEMAKLYWGFDISLNDLVNKILNTDIGTLQKLLKSTPAEKLINQNLEKAALSVLMLLSTYLKPLKLYKSNQNCFSIREWVQDDTKTGFLFISSLAEAKQDLNPIISAQVDIAINSIRSMKEESNLPKIWLIIDELPYFDQPIPTLRDGLATARSFGGCFVLGTQDISSLEKIYSRNAVESMSNNCRTKLLMSVDSETAKWCSQALGEGEIEEWHEGLSYGANEIRDGVQVNRQKAIRRIVLPSEFSMLGVGEGYIKMTGFEAARFKTENIEMVKVAKRFVENKALVELLTQEVLDGHAKTKRIEASLEPEASIANSEISQPKRKTTNVF